MKMIPLLRCNDMKEAIDFYTGILDFEIKYNESSEGLVLDLVNGEAEIQLTSLEGDQRLGIAVNVHVSEVDKLFQKYVSRGLAIPTTMDSPAHQGPLNQTWGMREFYVSDPGGNTLRFRAPIKYQLL